MTEDPKPFDLEPESVASLNLKRIRTALGVSQQEICNRLSKLGGPVRLMQTQIAKIERGERPWRVNELQAIAHVLEIGIADLLRPDGAGDQALELIAASQALRKAAVKERAMRQAWEEARDELDRATTTFARLTGENTPTTRPAETTRSR